MNRYNGKQKLTVYVGFILFELRGVLYMPRGKSINLDSKGKAFDINGITTIQTYYKKSNDTIIQCWTHGFNANDVEINTPMLPFDKNTNVDEIIKAVRDDVNKLGIGSKLYRARKRLQENPQPHHEQPQQHAVPWIGSFEQSQETKDMYTGLERQRGKMEKEIGILRGLKSRNNNSSEPQR
jgi:hypothetical protein